MSRLHLSFLGNPKLHHGEQPLTFRTSKAQALLIYLVVAGGMHSREKLTAFFWPQSEHKSGRANLRSTLFYLRRTLHHKADQAPSHLIVTRQALGFNFDSDYTLDLDILASARRATGVDALQEAADCYRGDFLEGFTLPDAPAFDDWVSYEREQRHLQMNEVFDHLSRLLTERGSTREATQVAQRWLALNPLREQAYQRLIRLHLIARDRGAAQQAYDSCRHMLQEELGAQPAPETLSLAEQIHSDGETASLPAARSPVQPSVNSEEALVLPFVGRAREHTHLVAAYHHAQNERSQIVILEGEAGIGKTRLAHEFLAWVSGQGADVLAGRAFETGGRLPYQPLVTAIRNRVERENAPEDLLADVWLVELSRLLPELRERYPDLPTPVTGETSAQARLFEAVTRLVQSLAAQMPLVIFIDDIQWADSASLDLLAYAGRRWAERGTPLLLLLALRTEALVQVPGSLARPTLAPWLEGLERDLPLRRLKLEPLTEETTRTLIRALTGKEKTEGRVTDLKPTLPSPLSVPRSFADWLFAETQGQPLFITETIKTLLDQGMLVRQAGYLDVQAAIRMIQQSLQQKFIPPGVREVVRSRLTRLSETAFNLLAAAAVLGQNFDFKQLGQVAGVQENEGLSALDELLRGRLLTAETGLAPGQYQFIHNKIRDVVYAEAGEARRQLFHKRALAYLQHTRAAPAQLAHHALIASLGADAFHYSLAAGDEAMRVFAVKEAIRHYEQAQISAQEVSVSRKQHRHLFLQLGQAYEWANDWDKAKMTYQAMRLYARKTDSPTIETTALNRLATVILHATFDGDQAIALLHRARQLAEQHHDRPGLAKTEWNLSHVSFYILDRQAAITHGERALALARELGRPETIARSLNALVYAKGGLPEYLAEVQQHAEEARTLYAGLGNRAMEIDSWVGVAWSKIHQGRPEAGVAELRQAYQMSREIENSWGQVNCALHLATGLLECGQYGEALDIINTGVAIARANQFSGLLAHALTIRGNVYRAWPALSQALADHQEARTIFDRLPMSDVLPFLAVHLCADQVLLGDWPAAFRYAQQALSLKDLSWLFAWLNAGFSYWYVVAALLHEGDIKQGREIAANFGQIAGDNPRYQIPHLRCMALLGEWMDDKAQAVMYLEEALTLTEQIGLPGERRSILARLAELYSDETRAAEAIEIVNRLTKQAEDKKLMGF